VGTYNISATYAHPATTSVGLPPVIEHGTSLSRIINYFRELTKPNEALQKVDRQIFEGELSYIKQYIPISRATDVVHRIKRGGL